MQVANSAPHTAVVEEYPDVTPLTSWNKCNLVNLVPPPWKGGERKWRVQDQGKHEPETHLLLLSTREPFVPWLAPFISQLSCVCAAVGNWGVFFLNLVRVDTTFCPTTLCQQHHHSCFLEALTQKLSPHCVWWPGHLSFKQNGGKAGQGTASPSVCVREPLSQKEPLQ